MYPLNAALNVAGVKPGKFHSFFYRRNLEKVLTGTGDLSDHMSLPKRGPGVGRGGSRMITEVGTAYISIFFALISAGVTSDFAAKIALTFVNLGETGNGMRAFKFDRSRPPGNLFPGPDSTYLVALTEDPRLGGAGSEGFAFIPAADLTAQNHNNWTGLHEADSKPVCLINLSAIVAGVLSGLPLISSPENKSDTEFGELSSDFQEVASSPVGAFLMDCFTRNKKSRTPVQDFFEGYDAWFLAVTGKPDVSSGSVRERNVELTKALEVWGIRKMKSNGIITFAGLNWRKDPTIDGYLTPKYDLK